MASPQHTNDISRPSASRHPSPQPYPAPPATTGRPHTFARDSAVPQIELHRDVSNPFNRTSVSLDHVQSTPEGVSGERDVASGPSDGGADSLDSGMVASRPAPSPPAAENRDSESGNSSATAVDADGVETVHGEDGTAQWGATRDDGSPAVIATDYCESPAAIGLPEDVGGMGNMTTGSGSSAGGEKYTDGHSAHGKDGSAGSSHRSQTSTSSSKTSTPARHRADSASRSISSSASRPQVLSGLPPTIRSKLPSLRKDTGSRQRSGSLLPLPATTHREPTTRGEQRRQRSAGGSHASQSRRRSGRADVDAGGSSSSTSVMSTSRSPRTARRTRPDTASASSTSHARQQGRERISDETEADSETEVEGGNGRAHPSYGMSGAERAAGEAAASLVRRMTGGKADRHAGQSGRLSGNSWRGSSTARSNDSRGESFYARQARMVREHSKRKSDDEMLRQQLAEDGLILDDDGEVINRDRGWSNPPSRGGSGDKEKKEKKEGGGDEDGGQAEDDHGDNDQDRDRQDDTPVPSMPRRATFSQSVSYTSTVVYTSIFADIKNDSIAMAGEFVGTILFLITSLGAAQAVASMHQEGDGPPDPQASTIENLVGTFYKAFATGTALYGTASIFYRFTGSIFNPSVSLALALTGVIRPVRFLLVSTSQMLGGIVAAYILHGLVPGQTDINLKLTASANIAQGLFIETFATTTLILAVLMLGVEKHLVTPHAPLGFGLTLSASMLFAMPYTGAGINVARAFGTALIQGFQPYHWIYWLGPTIGAFLASAFYVFLRYIQYWEVNPGQDSTQPLTGPPETGRNLRKKVGMRKRDILSPKG